MAQRTGAERFLAPLATSASAGVILALALAAFLLAGCGSSSDEDSTEAAGTDTSAAAVAKAGDGTGSGAPGAQGEKAGEGSGSEGSGAPGAPEGNSPQGQAEDGQKHGRRIASPKGEREQAPTPEQITQATVADMSLRSPVIVASGGNPGTLPATYTCDGKDSWPELRWGGVPPGTAELVLYAMSVQPVEEQLFVDWAVAGLDPGLTGIDAGELPKGAVVGTNGFGKRGYSICPTGSGEIYMFAIYALPQALSPQKGFDARELRKEILDVSGNVGLLPAIYARG